MRLSYCAVVLCLLSGLAAAQSSANSSSQGSFHGIRISSSKFDPTTSPQTVQLDFINDSPNNLTAWAYCVYADKVKESDPSQGLCTMIDVVGVEVDRQVQEKITLKTNPADLPTYHFVHPGEHKILSASFALPVISANVQIKLLAYSDGTVERSSDDWGTNYFQQLALERKAWLETTQEVVSMGKKILADATNPHPAQTMINQLQNRTKEPGMDYTLHFLKRPGWRHGNDKEFIPEDERDYLTKFVAEREMQANEYSKYLVREVQR